MKKKTVKKKKPVKQKIDVVIESLVHLEQRMKELIGKVESLHKQVYYHPEKAVPKNPPLYPPLAPMPTNPQPKYWPNVSPNTKWNPPEYN
jgi:hypothetical protein